MSGGLTSFLQVRDAAGVVPEKAMRRYEDVNLTGYADGGLIRKSLEKFGRRAARGEFDDSVEAPLGALSVVKQKGGNWINDSVEGALRSLKKEVPELQTDGTFTQAQANFLDQIRPQILNEYRQAFDASGKHSMHYAKGTWPWIKEAHPEIIEAWATGKTRPQYLNSLIDKQLTRYIKNDMATPEDPLRLMADAWPEKQSAMLADMDAKIAKATADMEKARTQRGFTPEMMTASQARINDLLKQRQHIEMREALHFEPRGGFSRDIYERRAAVGLPEMGMAKSEQAGKWEDLTDEIPRQASYQDHMPFERMYRETNEDLLRRLGGDFAVKNPGVLAYSFNRGTSTRDLGFDHLIDELYNAFDPQSGLPKNLLLDPANLPKMSLPQIVEHVSKINAHRAVSKAEADAAIARNPATFIHKDYPDADYHWVQLKAPEAEPEGFTTKHEGDVLRVLDASGQEIANFIDKPGMSGAQQAKRYFGRGALQDALKYEGDTMQHCVGGYCDSVLNDRSRIYSLRNKKTGQPYATIETAEPIEYWSRNDVSRKIWEEFNATTEPYSLGDFMRDKHPELYEKRIKEMGFDVPRIQQIKGPRNEAPASEVLPYVQDFVRSGQWSDVGDLHNTGLLEATPMRYTQPHGAGEGWIPRFDELGIDPGFYTNDELVAAIQKARALRGNDFAQGGTIRTYPKPDESPATTVTRSHTAEDVVKQFLSFQI